MKITKKDLKILQALDQDVRSSYAKIGKYAGISKETAQYRLKQLEKNNIITGYWTLPRLGSETSTYKLLIKNKSLGVTNKNTFLGFIKNNPVVAWAATTRGNWDYIITCMNKQDSKIVEFMDNLQSLFGKYFSELHILKTHAYTSLNEKYLYEEPKIIIKEQSMLEELPPLDERDQQILKLISENARISFIDIAKELKVTGETISNRFKKVLKSCTALKPRINIKKLGLNYYHLFISLTDYSKKDKIKNYFNQNPNCIFMMDHLGKYHLHAELVSKEEDVQTLLDQFSEFFSQELDSYELCEIVKEHLIEVKQ